MNAEPIRQRMAQLADELLRATESGKAKWTQDEEDETRFYYAGSSAARVAVESRDNDDQPPYDLYLLSPEGRVLDELRWGRIGEGDNRQLAPWALTLRQLYGAARSSAAGTGDLIEGILRDLTGGAVEAEPREEHAEDGEQAYQEQHGQHEG